MKYGGQPPELSCMAYPSLPIISYDYSAFEQAQGDGSFPGTPLDGDLVSLAGRLTSAIQFLEVAFRSDGVLKNSSAPDSATPPGVPIEVTGSRATGIALVNRLVALEKVGIIIDNTTA